MEKNPTIPQAIVSVAKESSPKVQSYIDRLPKYTVEVAVTPTKPTSKKK